MNTYIQLDIRELIEQQTVNLSIVFELDDVSAEEVNSNCHTLSRGKINRGKGIGYTLVEKASITRQ